MVADGVLQYNQVMDKPCGGTLNEKLAYLINQLGTAFTLFMDADNPIAPWHVGVYSERGIKSYFAADSPQAVVDLAVELTDRWRRKKNQCGKKVRHPTLEEAQRVVDLFKVKALRIGNKDRAAQMRTYFCPHCHGFHNGKLSNEV